MATNNSANQKFTNNADGYDLAGGTTARKLTVTGADMTLTGSGTAVYTFPGSTSTIMAASGAGSAGQVLLSAGAGAIQAWSTPTYPSASGTSRKILVSDGTNNVYSTETYAVPGSTGNILTSDGTNWTSAAPAPKWSQLAAPTTTLSLTMPAGDESTFTIASTTQTGFTYTSTTLTTGMLEKLSLTGSSAAASAASSGSLLTLTSSTTGFTTATQRLGAIYSTGANTNSSVVLQALDLSVANTGTTNTNQALRLSASGGSTTNIAVDVAAGEIRLAGAAGSSGQLLQSKGANATPGWTTPTYPSGSSSSGKILVSDGTNYIASTPTFPNASATSRKIIVSDGTNWIASTETYAVPGTSGNVLTSDGTNWTSAAPSTGTPKLTLAFDFSASTRYVLTGASGTINPATFDTNGLNLAGGLSATRSSIAQILTSRDTESIFAQSPTFTAMVNNSGTPTTGSTFFGLGDVTVAGTGITYTPRHTGFKVTTSASTQTLFATQADGTTETASASLGTTTLGDTWDFILRINTTASIDYWTRKSGGAISAATNLTGNMPTGGSATAMMTFAISNNSTATGVTFEVPGACYQR